MKTKPVIRITVITNSLYNEQNIVEFSVPTDKLVHKIHGINEWGF